MLYSDKKFDGDVNISVGPKFAFSKNSSSRYWSVGPLIGEHVTLQWATIILYHISVKRNLNNVPLLFSSLPIYSLFFNLLNGEQNRDIPIDLPYIMYIKTYIWKFDNSKVSSESTTIAHNKDSTLPSLYDEYY